MWEMVEARWEIRCNVSTVAIRASATAIMTEFGVPHDTSIKISLSVLGSVFLVDKIIAHVTQRSLAAIAAIFNHAITRRTDGSIAQRQRGCSRNSLQKC